MKHKQASKLKTAGKVIQYWQNKNNTHDVDYKAITEFARENKLLPVRTITAEEQIEALLRRAVKAATWKNPKGHKVKIYGTPRWIIEGELVTLPPVDMRYAKPDIAKTVLDADYEGMGNDAKKHAISHESYNDNNLFKATLPDYDYNFNHLAQEARESGVYDDSFDESELEDDEGLDEED